MIIYDQQSSYGWDGDGGLGLRLIHQIIQGTKTATCAPLSSYTQEELAATLASQGGILTVVDKDGKAWCNIRMLDVFQTTFGNPDPRLVLGEGDGEDVEKFKNDHRQAWKQWFATEGHLLDDKTVLIAEIFELVEVAQQ